MKKPREKKQQRPYAGELVELQSRIGGLSLPPGLEDGDEVKLLRRKNGQWQVDKNGSSFLIDPIHIRNLHRFNTIAAPPPKFE